MVDDCPTIRRIRSFILPETLDSSQPGLPRSAAILAAPCRLEADATLENRRAPPGFWPNSSLVQTFGEVLRRA
jgi:hypothetical protein